MSLIPTFEVGVWNAWILTPYFLLHRLIMLLIDKVVGTGEIFKKMGAPTYYNKTERIIDVFQTVLFFGLFICSVFLPLQLGTAWFYVGLALCLVGVVTWTIAIVNIADMPMGEPSILEIAKERSCLEKFSNFYREYINRPPTWIGLPKSS